MDVALLPSRTTYGRVISTKDFGGFALSIGLHAPCENVPAHQHADEYQWCLVLAGGFEETAGREHERCGPGSFVVRPSDCVHADRFEGARATCLNMFPKADWLSSRALEPLIDCYAHTRTRRLLQLGQELAHEFTFADDASPVAIASLVNELLASVARLSEAAEKGHPHWLAAALDRIQGEPASDLSLDALAADASVSPSHLARTFRARFGCTVGAYVREQRLERAMKLMQDPTQSLADIALAVGFHDQAHFTHAFKRRHGLTPTLFRNAL